MDGNQGQHMEEEVNAFAMCMSVGVRDIIFAIVFVFEMWTQRELYTCSATVHRPCVDHATCVDVSR